MLELADWKLLDGAQIDSWLIHFPDDAGLPIRLGVLMRDGKKLLLNEVVYESLYGAIDALPKVIEQIYQKNLMRPFASARRPWRSLLGGGRDG